MAQPTQTPPPKFIQKVQQFINGVTGAWMGPLQPLREQAPTAYGRQRDYPVGENAVIRTRDPGMISTRQLRNFVMNCDVVSALIETRKDQVCGLSWSIRPKDPKKIKAMGDKPDPKVKEIEAFFKRPDKRNNWATWIRPILDDMFVIDAATIYKRRDRGGKLYSIEIMDGSLIKVLVDEDGRIPMYPNPSYQQLLKGMPAVDYTTQDLIYAPRNLRSWTVYGYSVVEQIVVTIQTLINRATFNANYYLEGNQPDALLMMDSNLTVAQIEALQNFLDASLQGNLAARRKMKLLPGGPGSKYQEIKPPAMADGFDEYLVRVACFAFSMPPTAFVQHVNRSTSETSKDSAAEEGLAPTTKWIKEFHDRIIEEDFETDEYEFVFNETKEQDQKQAAEIRRSDVDGGIITPNEARETIGLDPLDDESANKLRSSSGGALGDPEDDEDDDALPKGKEVEKADGLKKNSIGLNSRVAQKAINATARKTAVVLQKTARNVAHQVENSKHLAKASDPTVEGIMAELDLSGLQGLSLFEDDYRKVYDNAAEKMVRELGVKYQSNMFNQINARALDFARSRAAELVTEITDTTRDRLRTLITEGIEQKKTRDQIAASIRDADSDIFGKKRSMLIADTEIGIANGEGALSGLKLAEGVGIKLFKEWLLTDEACIICQDNAAQGPIPLNEPFDSGDQASPAHPRCRCTIVGVVVDEN